ncbi:MAG: ABC transporter permease [Microthrixaceae bacterium]
MIPRTVVVARQELALLRSEIVPVTLYFLMPLAILSFIQGAFTLFLEYTEPGLPASGASLAAPGQATMFGFMSLAMFGHFFLGENGWGTWNRVRSMGVKPRQIMAGKMAVAYLNQLLLFAFVMGAGILLFSLEVTGSVAALVTVELVLAFLVVSYGLIACALATSQAQYNAFAYLGALVLAGVGGALTPFDTLPGWAQAIAPAAPTYWAVRAFETIILRGGSFGDVAGELVALAAFGVGFLALGVALFDPDKPRSTWA